MPVCTANSQPERPACPHLVAGQRPRFRSVETLDETMSGGGATKANEEYFTAHPWSGDNASHEDWEKCLTLKALALGGQLMYQWGRESSPLPLAATQPFI